MFHGFTQSCHPEICPGSSRYNNKMLKQVQHDGIKGFTRSVTPQGRYAGYSGRMGFTLIELLVVVLIIGILAAVAFPQYQKAVVKSRFADALPNLHAVAQASQACYLEKGRWCEFAELSLNLGVSPTIYPHIAINSKYVSDTKYFQYAPMLHSINTGEETYSWAIAQYKTEDVCLCYTQTGNIVVGDSNSCGTKEPSYNYADLLHLTYDEECACC